MEIDECFKQGPTTSDDVIVSKKKGIYYKIKIKAATKDKMCCTNTSSSVRKTFPEGSARRASENLTGNQEEVKCFRPMRLYINMQCQSERLDVCLITVLVVVCVWLSGRVVTRSDRLGTAERV